MKGNNWVGFITALLTFLAVVWQGYSEYKKANPAPQPASTQQQTAEIPVYWNDGRRWYCKVGEKQYIWVPETEKIAWQQQNSLNIR